MTLSPCLSCGQPANGSRCPEHTLDAKGSTTDRGYDSQWDRLSKRARRLQPFCTDCGSTEDLQLDHLPSAWDRKAKRLSIRLGIDAQVVCGPCNRARGAARGNAVTRGDAPPPTTSRPLPRQSLRFTPEST